ncbi:MAG TPA: cyanophycinase, partial [Gemmatimonadaceae bacterium]
MKRKVRGTGRNGARLNARHDGRPPRGVLVLIGGASTVDGNALGSFLELSGARSGKRLVGLTMASGDPATSAKEWLEVFRTAGATDVEIPKFDGKDSSVDKVVASMVLSAGGVFLGGGDQVALVETLAGTATAAALETFYREGGVIGGTSAGAAGLSELTMAGGELDAEGHLVEQYLGPGLGLIGFDAIIDTHFTRRGRLQRLFLVVARNPKLLGIGIDEDTALVVRGHIGEVVGAGGVTFIDARDTVRYDNAAELEKGRQLTISHLRVGIVGTHHRLNLQRR